MKYFLGADGGGTKTKAVIIDANKQVIATEIGVASNIRSEGIDNVISGLDILLKDTCRQADITIDDLSMISLGLAGVGNQAGRDLLIRRLSDTGIDQSRLHVVTDGMAALSGAHSGNDGIIAIAGTGMVILGAKNDQIVQSGGWGHLLGDEGSAYWIGIEGMKSVLAQADGRGSKTLLTEKILAFTGSRDVSGLIDYTYGTSSKKEIAAIARIVIETAFEDEEAERIAEQGAIHLFDHIQVVHERLGGNLPVALIGGVVESNTPVRSKLLSLMDETGISFIDQPAFAPELGAAFLGMRVLADKEGAISDFQ